MNSTPQTTNGTAALADRLLQLGWQPGVPDDTDDSTFCAVGIDAACAASLACPHCAHKGMAFLPLSSGLYYTGVLVCPACHFQTEG